MSTEYSQRIVGNSGCSYNKLQQTYGGKSAMAEIQSNMVYNVPGICQSGPAPNYPPPYDTLTGSSTCGGKPSLGSAYPYSSCNSCMGVPNPSKDANAMLAGPNGRVYTRGCASKQVSGC